MDWGLLVAAVGVLLSALTPVEALSRRARLRSRLRQTLELLKELPEPGQDKLRSALAEVADVASEKLALIESAWADLQRDKRKRLLRNLVLVQGWNQLAVAVTFLVFRTEVQAQFGWPAWLYWLAVVSIAVAGASFIRFAYEPRVLATFASDAVRPRATKDAPKPAPERVA